MNAAANKGEFGDKLAMWSTVGSSRQWDWGTPDQFGAEVQGCIQELGPEGLLPAPAYNIDLAYFDDIVAFVETGEECGQN